MSRRSATALIAVPLAIALAGCSSLSLNNRVLPGSTGTGDDGYELVVQLADAGNLVPNGEVKVKDKTVGTIKRIELTRWTASVTVGVLDSIELPQGSTARIGQKSLLGSEYLELAPPPDALAASGPLLTDGSTIPLAQSGSYTDTEELLSTLSLWLNGGGLQHVQTITKEVNTALQGNEAEARDLIAGLDRTVSGLDDQKTEIVAALRSLDDLSTRLVEQKETIGAAVERLPAGLTTIDEQREDLTGALVALDSLSQVTNRVVTTSGEELVDQLKLLQPVLGEIAAAANSLPDVLDVAGTVLFPVKAVPNVIKGDYLNAAVTIDLALPSIVDGFLPNSPIGDALSQLRMALQAGNPLTGPLSDGINDLTGGTTIGPEDATKQPIPGAPSTGSQAPIPSPTGAVTPAPTSPPPGGLEGLLGSLLGGGRS